MDTIERTVIEGYSTPDGIREVEVTETVEVSEVLDLNGHKWAAGRVIATTGHPNGVGRRALVPLEVAS